MNTYRYDSNDKCYFNISNIFNFILIYSSKYSHVYDNAISTTDIVIGINFYQLFHRHENTTTIGQTKKRYKGLNTNVPYIDLYNKIYQKTDVHPKQQRKKTSSITTPLY